MLFKELTASEIEDSKKWARENYECFSPIKGIWHPAVQEECVRMNSLASKVGQRYWELNLGDSDE